MCSGACISLSNLHYVSKALCFHWNMKSHGTRARIMPSKMGGQDAEDEQDQEPVDNPCPFGLNFEIPRTTNFVLKFNP